MLPKVSAALTKFIKPIKVSARTRKTRSRTTDNSSEFKRFHPKEEDESPPQETENPPQEPPMRLHSVPNEAPPPENLSVAQNFLVMLHKTQARMEEVGQGKGSRSYRESLEQRDRQKKIKKGTMLDKKQA